MSYRRIWLLTTYDLKHNILGLRGLLYIIPFCLYWIVIFETLKNELSEELINSQQGLAIASMAISPEWVEYFFIDHPARLSLVFYILLTTLPGFTLLAGCNHLATDAGRKSFRYLLTRASRLEIFVSRNLSVLTLILISIALLLVYTTYFSLQHDAFTFSQTASYACYGFLISLIYCIPYIAFAAIFSSLFSGTISSLLSATTTLFLVMIVQLWNQENYPWVDFFLPSVMKESLLGLGQYELSICIVSVLAHALIFGGISWWIFSKRDL